MLFELISPERVFFSGEGQAVMLPTTEGDITVMPGDEATMVMRNPGTVAVPDGQGLGHRAFVRGGSVEMTGRSVSVPAERALPVEELTRDRLDEGIGPGDDLRGHTGDQACQEAGFAINRLEPVKTMLPI